MINENTVKQIIGGFFILILLVFTFLIIKPIFLSMLLGLILAYTFNPVNKLLVKLVKNRFLSAFITCSVTIGVLLVIIWFSLPLLINQVFDTYSSIQSFNTIGTLQEIFPFMFSSPQISNTFAGSYNTFLSTTAQSNVNILTNILLDIPSLIFKLMVVIITFFYGLRDGDKLIELLKNSLPFNKSTTSKFIQKSKEVTFSVVFGRVVIGIITGLLAGIGFYIAGVNNTLLFTVLAIITSIIPIIGPWIIWVPVVISLFVTGHTIPAIFLLLYCSIVVTLFESISHPVIVSRYSHIPNSLTLLGIIGGMLVFGISGIIIGPLVVAYLVILFELYLEYNVKKSNP
ncbi:MAG: AI-2E family transporter [Candidatus Pacearchaeota archaeon]|jgi:predicted PurR-regulated permease PerM